MRAPGYIKTIKEVASHIIFENQESVALKNKEYFGILDGLRVKMMELFTLYVIWIGENYEEAEIKELFSYSKPHPDLRKGFECVGYAQQAGLTESQAVALLEVLYLILISNYPVEKIAEFFKHRKVAKSDDPFITKVYKACRHCGSMMCFHKARGLCNYCYNKFIEKRN